MVLKGRLVIQLREGDVTINEGEFAIIPHGVEHKPVAEEETHVLLMEPKSTRNTGTENNERTVEPDWL
jgi:mannose-6-phosphate isomerase-like protein (cupin superfamily)